jgi:NAD(P)-dependent dehydrogenase (short-subunit alcohol dehydrogenase family)
MANASAVWFITGCSTGFGRELAKQILERGLRAVISARNPQSLQDLAAKYPQTALVLELDVTDRAQIASAVQQAEARFGRIDVLVNNAGYGYMAAIEEGEDAVIRAMFEVNVFGLAAVTQAVLPIMRRQRSGHIFNLSSVAGCVGLPGVGYYNASKFAVEGMSEALSKEAAPLGIRVTIVEPGPFRTDFGGRSLKTPATAIADYAETAGARRGLIMGRSGNEPGDPARVAAAIIDAAHAEKAPLHLVMGRPAFEIVGGKLRDMLAEMEALKDITLAADYPESQ